MTNSTEILATAIIISIFLHFLSIWSMIKFVPPSVPRDSTEVEVVYQTPTPLKKPNDPMAKQQQFVRANEIPEKDLSAENFEPAQFLAAKSQRVREQMRARNIGPNQNSNSVGKDTKEEQQQDQKQSTHKQKITAEALKPRMFDPNQFRPAEPDGDYAQAAKNRQDVANMSRMPRFRESSTSEALPDSIRAGNMTVLNTDRHLFASFYDRFDEKTSYLWRRHVIDLIQRGAIQSGGVIPGNEYITLAEIVLDAQGYIKKVYIHKDPNLLRKAGNFTNEWVGFDQAVIDTMKKVPQIPNPPPEMVQKEDQTIRIYALYRVILR